MWCSICACSFCINATGALLLTLPLAAPLLPAEAKRQACGMLASDGQIGLFGRTRVVEEEQIALDWKIWTMDCLVRSLNSWQPLAEWLDFGRFSIVRCVEEMPQGLMFTVGMFTLPRGHLVQPRLASMGHGLLVWVNPFSLQGLILSSWMTRFSQITNIICEKEVHHCV